MYIMDTREMQALVCTAVDGGCTHKLVGGAGVLICMAPESIHLPGVKPIPSEEGLASEKVRKLTGTAHTRKTNLGVLG